MGSMERIPNTKDKMRHTILTSPSKGIRQRKVGLYRCKEHGVFKSPEYRAHCPICGKGGCARAVRGVAVE